MKAASALLDSNVAVAMLVDDHEHHADSLALLTADNPPDYAIAAHSLAETYATLTRRGDRGPSRYAPDKAWAALSSLKVVTTLVGLTPLQTVDAIHNYSASGGIGPRLYDALIGEVAVVHGISALVTWNTRHMAGLFPKLDVVTPVAFLASRRPQS